MIFSIIFVEYFFFRKISLYRATNQTEAEEKFNAFLHRLPTFVSIAKEVN